MELTSLSRTPPTDVPRGFRRPLRSGEVESRREMEGEQNEEKGKIRGGEGEGFAILTLI